MTGSIVYSNITTSDTHVQRISEAPASLQWIGGLSAFGLKYWQSEAIKGVYKIKSLPLNWDGEGGQPASSLAIQVALSLIKYLSNEELPPPFVVPTPRGGISFEWALDNRELDIEILPELSLLFLKTQSDEPIAEGPVDILGLSHLFKWLRNEPEASIAKRAFFAWGTRGSLR